MAIRELVAVPQLNFDVDKSTSFHAGDSLMVNTAGTTVAAKQQVVAADRSVVSGIGTARAFVGFAYDDHARSGNTMILADPVGSTYISSGVFTGEANGFFVADKRVLLDFQDETITNISNLTDEASGIAGPRRGVGVLQSPGNQFITDRYALLGTATTTTDSAVVLAGFSPGDICTYGASANKGLLVLLTNTTFGQEIARVDKYDSTAGLLYFTAL